MDSGDEGLLTLSIPMRVSPEPEAIEFLERYKMAENYALNKILRLNIRSIKNAHRELYRELIEWFRLPSRIAIDCYRDALADAKAWRNNPRRGRKPRIKRLSMLLHQGSGYRIRDGYVEIIGGLRLRIIGWDKRYDDYENREARLVYKNDKMILWVSKKIPKPPKYTPRGVLATDVNEKHIVAGNNSFEHRFKTAVDRSLHYKKLAENLQRKYSSTRYNAWLRRRGVRERIRSFHRRARNIVVDWAKKISHRITMLAKQKQYIVAREDLTGLIESLRKLPRSHRVALLILSYRRLGFWIDWQSEKHGVPLVVVESGGTSSICPRCGSRLKENGYRILRCPKCGFEADRDRVAILNIERRVLFRMGGSLTTPTAPQMTDVAPNRCGEPMNRSSKRGGGQTHIFSLSNLLLKTGSSLHNLSIISSTDAP